MAERSYWLVKSEPNTYSFSDLQGEDHGTAEWDGVRNYQARNTMRDDMKAGDGVLFYHSNVKPMAVVGTANPGGRPLGWHRIHGGPLYHRPCLFRLRADRAGQAGYPDRFDCRRRRRLGYP